VAETSVSCLKCASFNSLNFGSFHAISARITPAASPFVCCVATMCGTLSDAVNFARQSWPRSFDPDRVSRKTFSKCAVPAESPEVNRNCHRCKLKQRVCDWCWRNCCPKFCCNAVVNLLSRCPEALFSSSSIVSLSSQN